MSVLRGRDLKVRQTQQQQSGLYLFSPLCSNMTETDGGGLQSWLTLQSHAPV